MPFFILSVVLQVALVVHILKTGRSSVWKDWSVVTSTLLTDRCSQDLSTRCSRKAASSGSSALTSAADLSA